MEKDKPGMLTEVIKPLSGCNSGAMREGEEEFRNVMSAAWKACFCCLKMRLVSKKRTPFPALPDVL
jgi:hypothetical protein